MPSSGGQTATPSRILRADTNGGVWRTMRSLDSVFPVGGESARGKRPADDHRRTLLSNGVLLDLLCGPFAWGHNTCHFHIGQT